METVRHTGRPLLFLCTLQHFAQYVECWVFFLQNFMKQKRSMDREGFSCYCIPLTVINKKRVNESTMSRKNNEEKHRAQRQIYNILHPVSVSEASVKYDMHVLWKP